MATGDYIALNLTIIEILLVIIALLVAGVSVFGFFKVTEIAKARVDWYLKEEIDLPAILDPRIRELVKAASEEAQTTEATIAEKGDSNPHLDEKGEE